MHPRRRQAVVPFVKFALRLSSWGTTHQKLWRLQANCQSSSMSLRGCAARCHSWGRNVREEFLDPGIEDDSTDPAEVGLRPQTLSEFVGQSELKEHLQIVLEAAKKRSQALDHLLFAGPPGLGKTTLAGIIAIERGVDLHVTSGPALERAGDLAAILTKLGEGDVLFIDEIHRLSRAVEEILYPAMEDFKLDIVVGKGLRHQVSDLRCRRSHWWEPPHALA